MATSREFGQQNRLSVHLDKTPKAKVQAENYIGNLLAKHMERKNRQERLFESLTDESSAEEQPVRVHKNETERLLALLKEEYLIESRKHDLAAEIELQHSSLDMSEEQRLMKNLENFSSELSVKSSVVKQISSINKDGPAFIIEDEHLSKANKSLEDALTILEGLRVI